MDREKTETQKPGTDLPACPAKADQLQRSAKCDHAVGNFEHRTQSKRIWPQQSSNRRVSDHGDGKRQERHQHLAGVAINKNCRGEQAQGEYELRLRNGYGIARV
jgi:hypothetical protein